MLGLLGVRLLSHTVLRYSIITGVQKYTSCLLLIIMMCNLSFVLNVRWWLGLCWYYNEVCYHRHLLSPVTQYSPHITWTEHTSLQNDPLSVSYVLFCSIFSWTLGPYVWSELHFNWDLRQTACPSQASNLTYPCEYFERFSSMVWSRYLDDFLSQHLLTE